MREKELLELIDAVLDGEISEADFLRLEAELLVDEKARVTYYERLKLFRSLSVEAEALKSEKSEGLWYLRRNYKIAAGVAAAVALLFLAGGTGWQIGKESEPPEVAQLEEEPAALGFASLAEESDAAWEGGIDPQRGDLLPSGQLKLKSGMVQLELFSGVTVILEGECAFEVKSPMELAVAKGRVRALVPEAAHGFKVTTSNGEVVDLGTEFALNISEDRADMMVLNGEIEWYPKSDDKRSLVDGEALSWTHEGETASDFTELMDLPVISDLTRQFSVLREKRRESWMLQSEALKSDSRLLAYFPMTQEGDWQRRVLDASGAGIDGSIVAARRTSDRWESGKGALSFSPAGSRVRVAIPGEHSSLTFYCWARIDSLDRWYNSLFLTDGHELNEPHWQIMNDGRLFFSVKRRERNDQFGDKQIVFSPPFWSPEKSGRWFQIATVLDVEERSVAHYVNGEQLSKEYIKDEYFVDTVKIGAASIGNWNDPTRDEPRFAIRNLNGAIDEFAIFAEALDPGEIAELYRIGRP